MDKEVVSVRTGEIAVVTLNRPTRRNGVTVEMCRLLYDALREIAASDARVLLLAGAGNDFSVGADLGGGAGDGGTAGYTELAPLYHSATLLHEMPQVTIAAIDGGCAGAALGWACACDLRIASHRARFSTAFLDVGVSGDMGLSWTLSRLVGPARARDLLFLGPKLSGEEALAIGLVGRLVDAAALHAEAFATAERLAAKDKLALRVMKANLLSAEHTDLRNFIDIESARHLHVLAQGHFHQRAAKFVREPKV